MSVAEAERFAKDLAGNEDLRAKVAAKEPGLASILEVATQHGYDVTMEDAQAYLSRGGDTALTEAELGSIAGGHHNSSGSQISSGYDSNGFYVAPGKRPGHITPY